MLSQDNAQFSLLSGINNEKYLEPFNSEEKQEVEEMIGRAADACELWLAGDIQTAMNQVNS